MKTQPIVLELSDKERITAVIEGGKVAYEKVTDGSYRFSNGKMRKRDRTKSKLIQGFIPASVLKNKPEAVMKFWRQQTDAFKNGG